MGAYYFIREISLRLCMAKGEGRHKLKKRILVLLFCMCSVSLFSQEKFSISGKANEKFTPLLGDPIKIGMKVTLKEYQRSPSGGKNFYYAECEGKNVIIDPVDRNKITFDNPVSNNQLWQIIGVKLDIYENLFSKGHQYDLRRELEDDTINMINNFTRYNRFFMDEYLEDYIQSLLYKIHPATLDDGRPGNLFIKILKDSIPDAFCTPTGTIVVTTGLLSTIRSEDELVGVLAHEVAHFVLDHQIVNINKAIARQKNAEFWAGMATALAAVSEIYVNIKYEVNTGGKFTLATAMLSSSIANSIAERLGAKYSREQETEADVAATMTLEFLKKDPKACSAALSRIQTYSILNGDYLALSGSGTHPSLPERIAKIGAVDPNQFNSKKYDQLISFINTFNAGIEYRLRHLETCLQLADRNIEAGVATEEDYLLKGITVRMLYDTPERNQEALDLIVKAKTLNVNPEYYPQIFKQEGITLLRLGKKQEAISSFQIYLQKLEAEKEKPQFVLDEIAWTKKMIFKTKSMQINSQ